MISPFDKLRLGAARFLNKHGDGLLFGAVSSTPPIATNPDSDTGIHTAVPHRYLYAYLTAIKSLLRFHQDLAVYVHDDGTLRAEDKLLIERHLPGVLVIERAWADQTFEERVGDEFLSKVRKSYTSYLKLFDPTLVSTHHRIIIVDTDVLFLHRPTEIIDWALKGGPPWYHKSGPWYKHTKPATRSHAAPSRNVALPPTHIQGLVVEGIPQINESLGTNYAFVPGFNSGLIGYEQGTVEYGELKRLLTHLYGLFGERIFKWGSEQTMHGLILCGKGAKALPTDAYMVYTDLSRDKAAQAAFVHFIGEFRYNGFKYPLLARRVIREIQRHSVYWVELDRGVGHAGPRADMPIQLMLRQEQV